MRWILLEEIIEIQKGKQSRARGRVPASSVSVQCLVIEMMAQTGGLLAGLESDFKDNLVFAKIEDMIFLKPLHPGDLLEIRASSDNLKREGSWIQVCAFSDGEQAAEGKVLLMNAGNLHPEKTESITFHSAFMKYYRPQEKVNSCQ